MRFSKWHALGNSYLLLERAELGRALEPEQARRLCDSGEGVGADGVVEVLSADGPRAEIAIWNPDGSRAEFSGNGTRIAAAWLLRQRRRRRHGERLGAGLRGDQEGWRDRAGGGRGRRERAGDDRGRRRGDRADPGLRRQPARGRPARATAGGAPATRAAARAARALPRADERAARPDRRARMRSARSSGNVGRGRRRLRARVRLPSPPPQSRTAGARARSRFECPAASSTSRSPRICGRR